MKFETLVDVLTSSVDSFPDRELFGTKTNGTWRWMTYLEFGKAVTSCRAGLAALGFERGQKLAMIANNRVEWAVFFYAACSLGISFVPMYEAQHAKEWEFILRDCSARGVVVASEAIREKVEGLRERLPDLAHVISLDPTSKLEGLNSYVGLLASPKHVAVIKPAPADVACIIYTSGTTGNPKGVLLTHNNISSNLNAIHDIFPITSSDRSLSFLPWAHVFGQTVELHALLSAGASIGICEAVDKIIDNLAEVQPTLLFSVPRIFNRIYASVQKQIGARPAAIQKMVKIAMGARKKQRDGGELGLSEGLVTALVDKVVFTKVRARFGGRLRYAFSGGAAISTEVAEFIDGLGITVYEGYGLTETSPIISANWPGSRRIGSVGKVVPHVRVEISAEGEIIVYGPNVMKGYHNRPEENAAVFTPDGGFRTGDMGKFTHGFLYITGRIKEQYKLENGKYVVPTPIEENIKLSPMVANAMVYGDNKPYNVAVIVPAFDSVKAWAGENGVTVTSDTALIADSKVRELFRKELAEYAGKMKGFEEVRDFALVTEDFTADNGMLTPSMKVKRKKVLEVHGAALEALYLKKSEEKRASA
jgi:long-chain acyl-CoA synthetase